MLVKDNAAKTFNKLVNNINIRNNHSPLTFQIQDIIWRANDTMDIIDHTEDLTENSTTVSVISTKPESHLVFNVFLITLSIFFTITIVFGNMAVLFAILKERKNHRKTDYFLGSLALAGAYVGAVSVPLITQYTIIEKWLYGDILCKMWMISDWTMNAIAQSTIYIITWDRYLSVTRPIWYRNWKTESKVFKVIVAAWIANWIFYPILILGVVPKEFVYDPDQCAPPFLEGPWITFGVSIAVFWIFTFIMMYQYWVIYKVVRGLKTKSGSAKSPVPAGSVSLNLANASAQFRDTLSKTALNLTGNHISDSGENDEILTIAGTDIGTINEAGTIVDPPCLKDNASVDQGAKSNKQSIEIRAKTEAPLSLAERGNRKILIVISVICGVFLLSWIPFFVMNSLPALCGYFCVHDTAYLLITYVNYLNNAVNPYVYAYLNPRFRQVFLNFIKCGRKK